MVGSGITVNLDQSKLHFMNKIFRHFFVLLACSCCLSASAQTITTAAGTGVSGYMGDGGPATAAECGWVARVCVDIYGNVYFGDYSAVVVRRIDFVTGEITTVAGGGSSGYNGDGIPATTALLDGFQGLTIDRKGNLYIADVYNNRVRKVDTAGIIWTVAGTGSGGALGDGGPATNAALVQPFGITVDKNGNLYIADFLQNRVRMVDTFGMISTVAGNGTGGHAGDGGPATAAELSAPIDVALDTGGNLYINDFSNYCVRKVTTDGNIATIAGNGTAGFAGDGGPATDAEFNNVEGLCVDGSMNVFVVEGENSRVRKLTPGATPLEYTISTFAGNGSAGYSGDGGPATDASLGVPNGVAVDKYENVYIGDNNNNRLRKVYTRPTQVQTVSQASDLTLKLSPNPVVANGILSITFSSSVKAGARCVVVNALGALVGSFEVGSGATTILPVNFPSGIYLIRATTGQTEAVASFVVTGN